MESGNHEREVTKILQDHEEELQKLKLEYKEVLDQYIQKAMEASSQRDEDISSFNHMIPDRYN